MQPSARLRTSRLFFFSHQFVTRTLIPIIFVVSTSEIRVRAISIARAILDAGAKPGDCVMLVLPPSLDAMFAFWGCIYAGVIAVPVAPPDPNQPLVRISLTCFQPQPLVFTVAFLLCSVIFPHSRLKSVIVRHSLL
jgi:non-ribosomal peptide synthetase component F